AWRVDIFFRSDVNAISATRGHFARTASGSMPPRRAATKRAPSVGSPSTTQRGPSLLRTASLHRAPHSRSRCRPGSPSRLTTRPSVRTSPDGSNPSPTASYSRAPTTRTRTFISPFVSVPVLSEQITEAAPNASTAGSFRINAPLRIIRWRPNARLIVTIAGRPSGMRLDGLAHGERLAGQGGLVDAEARHFEEPSVRGDPVSRRKDDDLAGHQIAGWHGNDPALPQDVGLRCGEALQGFERSFRPILLDEAEDRVHDYDHDDQHGVVQVGGLSLEES